METTDGFERHMREVLHSADDQAAGFTAAQVIAGGRQRRRTRTAAVSGVALVAAGAVAVVPAAVVGGLGHGGHGGHGGGSGSGGVVVAGGGPVGSTGSAPTSPGSGVSGSSALGAPGGLVSSSASSASSATTPTSPATPSSSAPAVRVVAPGKTDLGDGYWLTLTANSETLSSADGSQNGPHYTDDGNQASGSIGIQAAGKMVSGLYLGPGQATSGKVTVDGTTYPTSIVTLAGHPGWSVAYALLPAFPKNVQTMSISVSDAAGHVLASFAPPPVH